MVRYCGPLTLAVLIGMVLFRLLWLKRSGIKAMHFGAGDRKDFLIPPFEFFYFYAVFAGAFGFPLFTRQEFFRVGPAQGVGAMLCGAGLVFMFITLVSFGRSFRVGIDATSPDRLVTTGIFAISRNPIYVAFGLVLVGEFLLFSNWILLVYACAGVWLFHRQVLLEEAFLQQHYGREYTEYCARVRRYL